MKEFLAILKKDCTTEFRTGVQLLPFVTVTILLSCFLGIGVSRFIQNSTELSALFHPLVWGVFLLSGSITLVRIFESDREANTLWALSILRGSFVGYYLAKVLFIAVLLFVNHLVASFVLASFFRVNLSEWFIPYLGFSVLVSLGYAGLGSLIGGFVSQHSQRSILFPLVFLPLLFPLFFSVLEISTAIAFDGGIFSVSGWLSLLIGLSTLYLILGINLFETIVKE